MISLVFYFCFGKNNIWEILKAFLKAFMPDAICWSSGQFYALSNTNIYAMKWTLMKWKWIELQDLAYIHKFFVSLRTSVIKGIFECLSVANSIHETFPMNEWGALILQIILNLVLLHHSIVAPKISAFPYHHGPFDYDRNSLQLILGALCTSMVNPIAIAHGMNTPWMADILVHPMNTIAHTSFLSRLLHLLLWHTFL